MNVSAAKQTEYHFAPLARFAARFRSTAPLTLYGTDAAELRGIDPQRLNNIGNSSRKGLAFGQKPLP
ncbi:hypothetical protein K9N68_19480 [Kovacikia minuta CCNUW1]|uniref:hypothetical protein n=1 Tax=Kovacikia minuta TaxID=2931930 RepID=UPI001CCD8AA1|nr:hypothetical protein [Kovacikia minuta]UBF23928.1 hypothetical protein K9N68_19480 [Kovacikia minuta CCNUW1]